MVKILILIIVPARSIIFYFTSKLFNVLRLVQSHTEASFSNTIQLCSSSANSDLKFLTAPSPAYKEVKQSDEHAAFEGNKQYLKAELRL